MLKGFVTRVLNPQKGADYHESEAIWAVLVRVCADLHIDVRPADHASSLGVMTDEMLSAIKNADIVFADANSRNQNVWYEIGYADCVDQHKVICIFRADHPLPFNRQNVRGVVYDSLPGAAEELAANLKDAIITVLKRTVFPSFLPRGEVESEKEASDQFVGRLPEKLQELGCQWLVSMALDAQAHDKARRAAIRALFDLGGANPARLLELTRQPLPPLVRAAVYERLSSSDLDVPPEVWQPRDLRDPVLTDAFSKAVSHYYVLGKLNDRVLLACVTEDALSAVINQALRKTPLN
jgi:hypothetical protein